MGYKAPIRYLPIYDFVNGVESLDRLKLCVRIQPPLKETNLVLAFTWIRKGMFEAYCGPLAFQHLSLLLLHKGRSQLHALVAVGRVRADAQLQDLPSSLIQGEGNE